MIITKIKRISTTNRFHLYIDEKWSGIFLDETLAFYKLKTGQEIDEEDFKKIKLENDQKVAFDMAISYLEKYSVTRKGVSDYLKKKNFDAFVVASTLKKLEDYQILNDEKFAQNYFETISQTNGKRAVANTNVRYQSIRLA